VIELSPSRLSAEDLRELARLDQALAQGRW
jgi:hypothetical protein